MYLMFNIVVCVVCVVGFIIVCGFENWVELVKEVKGSNDYVM